MVVTDLRREQAKGLESQGAVFKDSPKAVAESCEWCCSMLPYNQAVQAVGLGKGGLHEATSGAKLWIDFSSIDKKTIVGVNAELSKKGWTILDGSAGGVEEAAAAGTLSLWLSGSKAVVRSAPGYFQGDGQQDHFRRRAGQRQAGEKRHGDVRRGGALELWLRLALG